MFPPTDFGSKNSFIKNITELSNGNLAILQNDRIIRIIDVDYDQIQKNLQNWKEILGNSKESDLSLILEYEENKKRDINKPKEGKIDPKGDVHQGGNTFKGGSGGTDTQGLGGKGGVGRASDGNPVAQMSEEERGRISEEALARSKELSKEALTKRLQEIEMTEFDSKTYENYYSAVGKEISQLRVVLDTLEAKLRPREWLQNMTDGELDDRKLIDSVTGETNVYKRRGEQPPNPGSPQEKPKRLKFLVDLSASMFRFNGQDGRLDRLVETVLMVMESFHGFEHRFHYQVVGHSGDLDEIPLVDYGKSPKNRQERLKVLKKMIAHTEYCASGDKTIDALNRGVNEITQVEADEYYLFLVSDANLDRYDITAEILRSSMMKDDRVECYAVFIASFDDQAQVLERGLPAGRGFACLDTTKLPIIFRQIFQSNMLKE